MQEIDAHKRTDAELAAAPRKSPRPPTSPKAAIVVGISHELRTPLNAILGYAQLLERDTSSLRASARDAGPHHPPQRRASGRPDRGPARHLQDRGRAASSSIATRCGCRSSCDQLVNMFRLQAEAKGIGFVFIAPDRMPDVRLHRRKAAAPDPDQPAVQRHQVHPAQARCSFACAGAAEIAEFEITDTGIGIAAADLDAHLRAVRAGAQASRSRRPGHRPGPDHHPAADADHGRRNDGHQRARARAAGSACG